MSDENLEDLARQAAAEENAEQAKEGELVTKSEQEAEAEKMQACIESGIKAMAGLRMGVNKFYPFVSYGDDEKEMELISEGGQHIGALMYKHGMTGMEMPPWLAKWAEEIQAGLFFGALAFSTYKQVKEYNREQEEQAEQKQLNQGGNHGEKSEPEPTE